MKNIFRSAMIKPGVLLCLLLVGGVVSLKIYFSGKIYPGVEVAGINMSGWKKEVAEKYLKTKAETVGAFTLISDTNRWRIEKADIQLLYDVNKTVAQAMDVGRKTVLDKSKYRITPVYTLDMNKLQEIAASLAAQLNVPAKEPEVIFEAQSKQVEIAAGENGIIVDEKELVSLILVNTAFFRLTEIEIPMKTISPKLDFEQIRIAKEKAENKVGKKLTIEVPEEKETWTIDDIQIITWIDLKNGGWRREKINEWTAGLAEAIKRQPQNATFRFVAPGKVEEFKPSRPGRMVRVDETTEMIMQALDNALSDKNEAKLVLPVIQIPAEITTGEVNNLGIIQLLGKGESWFSGSITNRIYNLKKSAETISGTLVAPGETFSFNATVGEISTLTGYKPAYIIKEGKTILGDGGGVCQTSSTLFRAILKSGLPIEERTAHAYRVSYYEEKSEPGFDATVFQPSPDFKFTNDTPAYLLIQSEFDEAKKYLAFSVYGTSDGRLVEISKARIWERTPPPPDLYQDDPALPIGAIKQVEHAAWGAKVAFDWKVTRGGLVIHEKTFYSNYRPWQAVYLRGVRP